MASPTPAEQVRKRRATVLRLAGDGLSLRAIGDHVGVSKDTVKRDLAAAECDTSPPPEPAADATPDKTAAPAAETLPAEWIAITLDDDMRDHLAVLLAAGHTLTSAVGHAVEKLADAYRSAWDAGDCPRRERPLIRYSTWKPPAADPQRAVDNEEA